VLSSRTRIGSYEVIAPLGAGGMGEVYRARDSRLNRDVALKVLPASFAGDAERLARFAREAQVLAALNHPHIAAIYGLEEHGDMRALVLELVEGETLAARLSRGPIPVTEALEIAKQIAAALEAAHDQGIIHRDLKPANISLTKAGAVKVLDFGLAKLTESPGASGSLPGSSLSPTITSPALATHAGMMLGTAAYMSPEQARGREADRRADLWAFGCVLYEMLTGKQAFAGETVTDVIAAVVTKEPDLARLPADTPAGVRWLLTRCFQKDPRQRFSGAADAALLLDPAAAPGGSVSTPAKTARPAWKLLLGGAAAAIVLVATGVVAANYWRTPADVRPLLFEIPVNAPIDHSIAISPDGRRVVYTANTGSSLGLWVRSLDDLTPRQIPGTTGVNSFSSPFWSPDSRYIAFIAAGKLRRVEPDGGVIETVAAVDGQFGGGSWSRTGTLLIASNEHGLRSVPAAGGTLTDVTKRTPDELYHDCPSFLPDGKHYIYLVWGEKAETRAIYISALDSTTRTRLMAAETCPVYVNGYIITVQDQAAFARPFDAESLAFTGDAIPLATDIATFAGGEVPVLTASDTGVLAYRIQAGEAANRRLVWADRNGKQSDPIGVPLRTGAIQLSPDGSRVAYAEGGNGGPADIWVYDLVRGVKTRLTTDPGVDHGPVWSSDGRRVAYDSHRHAEGPVMYERVADGSAPERQIQPPEKGVAASPRSYSLDGQHLAFVRSSTGGAPWDLWVLPLSGGGKPFVYAASEFDESWGVVSPDGRWMAYVTNETGVTQVVVQPFPNPGAGKWQVSMTGGAYPRWRRDSRELYYVAANGDLVAVSVTPAPSFSVGSSTVLFRTGFGFTGQPGAVPYDVRADGQRFLLAVSPDDPNATPIRTVVNWPALVKGKSTSK
jgi:eukaryotic-like serine/threonine-protein kinase